MATSRGSFVTNARLVERQQLAVFAKLEVARRQRVDGGAPRVNRNRVDANGVDG